jgi:hypothetical protein
MISQQQQGANTVTSKELSYLTDSLKNEELLAKLAAQSAAASQSPELQQQLTQIIQNRLQNTDQLLRTLQQHSQLNQ